MKYYILEGEVNGHPIKSSMHCSRPAAESKLDDFLSKKGLQVEINRFPVKHTEEFVCNQHTRFFIRRVVIA